MIENGNNLGHDTPPSDGYSLDELAKASEAARRYFESLTSPTVVPRFGGEIDLRDFLHVDTSGNYILVAPSQNLQTGE